MADTAKEKSSHTDQNSVVIDLTESDEVSEVNCKSKQVSVAAKPAHIKPKSAFLINSELPRLSVKQFNTVHRQSPRPAVCFTCKTRHKRPECHTFWHVDGFILTDVCYQCRSLTKQRNCTSRVHFDGCPVEIDRGEIVEILCEYCNSIEKSSTCPCTAHRFGRQLLTIVDSVMVAVSTWKARRDECNSTLKLNHSRGRSRSCSPVNRGRASSSSSNHPRTYGHDDESDCGYYGPQQIHRNRTRNRSCSSSRGDEGGRFHRGGCGHADREPPQGRQHSHNHNHTHSRGRSRSRSRERSPDSAGGTHGGGRRVERERYLEAIIRYFGFDALYEATGMNIFRDNPSVHSALKALCSDKFSDLRERVEQMYENRHNVPDREQNSRATDGGSISVKKLSHMLSFLGFDALYAETGLRVFSDRPSINSSMRLLMQPKMHWVVVAIEALYERTMHTVYDGQSGGVSGESSENPQKEVLSGDRLYPAPVPVVGKGYYDDGSVASCKDSCLLYHDGARSTIVDESHGSGHNPAPPRQESDLRSSRVDSSDDEDDNGMWGVEPIADVSTARSLTSAFDHCHSDATSDGDSIVIGEE